MKYINQNLEKTEELMTSFRKKSLQHHVYLEWYLNGRAGGPPGYLANLLFGLNQIKYSYEPLIIFDTFKGSEPSKGKIKNKYKNTIKELLKKFVYLLPKGKDIYATFSKYQKRQYEEIKQFLVNTDEMMPNREMIKGIDFVKTKTIHVHTVIDVVKIKNYLRKNFYDDVIVILTCHTPEPYSQEQFQLYVEGGQSKSRAEILRELWYQVEIRGYKEADIIIFPSEGAMEPYYNAIPEFANIVKNKDIRFMATGTKALCSKLEHEEAKEKYGVSGKYVVGYIGRHNHIKGYDVLKSAAEIVLKERKDVVFLIGGKQGNAIRPLNDPNWMEAGWVNPADLFKALDVFVLPNRQTYYDLVLLEVLSMGIPVIATATGGNVSVSEIAEDIVLTDIKPEYIAEAILSFIQKDDCEISEIRNRLNRAYKSYFTEINMAERYVDTIKGIYNDYNLWEK